MRRRSRTLSARSGFGEPARGEHSGDLPVELCPVGDDDHCGLLLRLVAAQLQGQPQHGQALARPLRVPDHAAPLARPPRRPDAPHRLVHGDELPVAGQLADGPAALHLEHHEVPHDVEEVAGFQQPVEQHVLRRRRAPEPLAELRHAQRIRLLPFQEEPLRRPHRAVDRALAAGADENLRRLEQPRRPLVLPARVGLLVAPELLHRFGLPRVADGGALALDDREGQAVDEGDDVGDDVLLRPEHPVLAGDDPVVALGPVEVEEPDGVALAPAAAVLLEGDAVGERRVDPLVRLGEAGRGDLAHRLHRLGDVRLGQPGVQPFQRRGQAAGEEGLLEAGALGLEGVGRDVGVAERLEELDRGVLREAKLVPAGRLGGHGSGRRFTPRSARAPRRWQRATGHGPASRGTKRLVTFDLRESRRGSPRSSCRFVATAGDGLGGAPPLPAPRHAGGRPLEPDARSPSRGG